MELTEFGSLVTTAERAGLANVAAGKLSASATCHTGTPGRYVQSPHLCGGSMRAGGEHAMTLAS